jgi:TrmH family RNA methyltransferase
VITSLHSPHVEAVKALLGSRGSKERRQSGRYVIEGAQNINSALSSVSDLVEKIYYTAESREEINSPSWTGELIEVAPNVMKAMSDTVTPQGLIAVARISDLRISDFKNHPPKNSKIAYFWEIQDPGNAGTVIRAADAFGFDAVIFSNNSVDAYSPKVVRSTAGSFWNIPLFEDISEVQLLELSNNLSLEVFATFAEADLSLKDAAQSCREKGSIWIFGNEARGIPNALLTKLNPTKVAIPMSGSAESLNLATAASVVMYAVANA